MKAEIVVSVDGAIVRAQAEIGGKLYSQSGARIICTIADKATLSKEVAFQAGEAVRRLLEDASRA